MRRVLVLTLAVVFCLGLVNASIDAKSKTSVITNRGHLRDVHTWLGVYTQTVDKNLADAFKIDVNYGAIVNEVIKDSPADKAGLKDGDVIISFDGRKVWDSDDLIDYIDDSDPGNKVELVVERDGKQVNVDVELGNRPRNYPAVPSAPTAPNAPSAPGTPHVYWFDNQPRQSGGYIGVNLSQLTDQLAEYFGVTDNKGVLIAEVEKDSPAEKAGLKAGDVITDIDDESVSGYDDVRDIISDKNKGDQVELTIVRNRKSQKIRVDVDEHDRNGYSYGYGNPIPLMPDIDIQVPRGIGRFNFDNGNGNGYFDYDNYRESMDNFRKDMEKYKEEMRDLSKDMSRLKKDERSQLQDQIEELKAQIRDLKEKLDK